MMMIYLLFLVEDLLKNIPFLVQGEDETIDFVGISKGKAMTEGHKTFTNIQAFYDFIYQIFIM